ncbi:ETX/MTX2 family pore-forming toxin [Bacillus toyonensis]|uniref:Sulfurtransferase n=1 Tax=Bacillus toyonensis TaxID=155322 RepID=A0A2A7XZV4_9BACI|nr:ETX/MTX2 family pore-forming toxin [Bacillus toyonensis]PEJ84194.1 sulfurtransferase [Bacillus toyonensis]PEK74103.1 sulfurtransferase [Bacillus toyonensis]PEL12632.1 sulfurtransferase [Bacillus toyonensis]PFY34232.1 sulfurtransferase [Bacillus toyonensis]PFY48542.1 sulfurtransferase [Bacillus toyonensis]
MKNNKKKKQILSLAMLASIGTSLGIISPDSVSAAQTNPIQNTIQEQRNVSISDWRTPIQDTYKAAKLSSPNRFLSNEARLERLQIYQSSVEADGSPTITDSKSLFVGKTTLTNRSNQDQILTTNQFSKTFENSITNSTTHGFNFGVSTSATFGIKFLGETNVEISTEYNFSNTVAKTKTESYTYTATPQNIVVPANSSVEVIVTLNTNKISGNVKLLTHVDGEVRYQNNPANLGSWRIEKFKGFLGSIHPKDISNNLKAHPQNGVYVIGTGNYSAEYGTEFSVTVRPVTNLNTSPAKSSSMVSENSKATNEGYTYTVKPEVKKEQ